ncbi:MAG: hypothetical protein ACRDTD_19315, partial [Pseudonocardiaceae bacterium]
AHANPSRLLRGCQATPDTENLGKAEVDAVFENRRDKAVGIDVNVNTASTARPRRGGWMPTMTRQEPTCSLGDMRPTSDGLDQPVTAGSTQADRVQP